METKETRRRNEYRANLQVVRIEEELRRVEETDQKNSDHKNKVIELKKLEDKLIVEMDAQKKKEEILKKMLPIERHGYIKSKKHDFF